jgi:hypothetical protein
VQPILAKRRGRRAGLAGPPDPCRIAALHDRVQGCHQPAGAPVPTAHAMGVEHTLNREAVGGNHQIEGGPNKGHAPSPPVWKVWP